jgi:uncharacterized protein
MPVQLEEPHLKALRTIVAEQVDTATWQPVVFGSRASGRAQQFSDIDLGFIGPVPLPERIQAQLWDALDESDIPYVVDIVDLTTAGAEFRQVAEQAMVRL